MELQKALEGLIVSRSAEGVSPHTIQVYRYGINKLSAYLKNPQIESSTKENVQRFFVYLRKETSLSESSLVSVRRAISVLFRWAEKEPQLCRPDKDIAYPKAPIKNMEPFSSDEIRRLLSACNYAKPSRTTSREAFMMKRPTAQRDKTIILVLLDTGLRVSELARLKLKNLNLKTGELRIHPHG